MNSGNAEIYEISSPSSKIAIFQFCPRGELREIRDDLRKNAEIYEILLAVIKNRDLSILSSG